MSEVMNYTPKTVAFAAGLGACLLGAIGFAAGFFGPIVVNPEANQGPLMGIFITGPGGAALGAAVGALLGFMGVSKGTLWKVLGVIGAVGAAAILFFALPGPKFRGNVLELEVLSCSSPAALKAEAFAYWEKRLAAAHWAAPRPGWKEGFEELVASDPGVVLSVKAKRAAGLYENRKPWNKGTFSAGKAWWVGERYFLRAASCEGQQGRSAVYAARGEESREWPSERLPNFLNLSVLTPATAQQTALLP